MTVDLVPRSIWDLPTLLDEEDWLLFPHVLSGLSVYEDEKHIYVEAAVPGLEPKDVEVTFESGMLWIKGEVEQEKRERRFYRKASSRFSYRVRIPEGADPDVEPEAICKNGVMKVLFAKTKISQPKKIAVKT